jgi:hypothetical protein
VSLFGTYEGLLEMSVLEVEDSMISSGILSMVMYRQMASRLQAWRHKVHLYDYSSYLIDGDVSSNGEQTTSIETQSSPVMTSEYAVDETVTLHLTRMCLQYSTLPIFSFQRSFLTKGNNV